MLKKKHKRTPKPQYLIASFRKTRDKKVTRFLEQSKEKLKSLSKLKSPIKDSLKKRMQSITYFDGKRFHNFTLKYIKFVKLSLNVDVTIYIDYIISRWEKECMENGPIESLKLFKELYTIASRISTSNTFKPISFRKSNRRGEPKLLGPLLRLLKGSLNERRAALAVLSLLKVVETFGDDYSINTILKEAPIKTISFDEFPKVGNYLKRFIEEYGSFSGEVNLKVLRYHYFNVLNKAFPERYAGDRLIEIAKLSNIHISGRNGPNGPCLSTAVCDWQALQYDDSSRELLFNIKKMSLITKNEKLLELMESFTDESINLTNKSGNLPIHSKISLKGEPWGRLRPFAICDYFSQSSLCGLHKYLFRWLEDQPEDGTYSQDRVSEEVRKWTLEERSESSCESADLSAATDSIPVEVQGEILAQIAGQDFAKVWMNIVSNRSFQGPDGESIRYATGQPMGILSSWGMMAVWHHIMVRTCQAYIHQPRIQTQSDYYIIGDDVALRGPALFRIYETLVRDVQGVGISKLKGFHKETQTLTYPIPDLPSGDRNTIHTAELAKRIFCNGIELTVIPPNEVLTSSENILQFPELFQSMKTRGYDTYNNIQSVSTLSQIFFNKRKSVLEALTLATCPVKETPLFQESDYPDLQERKLFRNILWFNPQYDRLAFIDQLIGTVMLTMSSSVPVTFMRFSTWEMAARNQKVRSVKCWEYSSESQNLLLNLVVTECKRLFFEILMGRNLAKSFPKGEPINWSLLKKTLQSFQTIVEIDYVYTDSNKVRNEDRIKFMNSFLNTEVRKAFKKFELTTMTSVENKI